MCQGHGLGEYQSSCKGDCDCHFPLPSSLCQSIVYRILPLLDCCGWGPKSMRESASFALAATYPCLS